MRAPGFHELPTGPAGLVVLYLGLVGFGLVLDRLRRARTRKAEGAPWWFGYARDITNLMALLVTGAALAIAGYAPPLAFLYGFLLTLATYLADYGLAHGLRLRHASMLAALGGVLLTIPVVLVPARCADLMNALLLRLF